jgi:hypothetical protein
MEDNYLSRKPFILNTVKKGAVDGSGAKMFTQRQAAESGPRHLERVISSCDSHSRVTVESQSSHLRFLRRLQES